MGLASEAIRRCEVHFEALSSKAIFLFYFLPSQGRTKGGVSTILSPLIEIHDQRKFSYKFLKMPTWIIVIDWISFDITVSVPVLEEKIIFFYFICPHFLLASFFLFLTTRYIRAFRKDTPSDLQVALHPF